VQSLVVSARLLSFLSRELERNSLGTGKRLDPGSTPAWSRADLSGRLTEISGQGATSSLSAAVTLMLDAQRAGEPCAWLGRRSSCFFPPDLAESGIDLAALAVVFTPSAQAAVRAAGRLVRSGGFGLVIADLGSGVDVPSPLQGRLSSLALKHDTAIVLITQKPPTSPSLGSMISLRVEARRSPLDDARFVVRLDVLKDKRRGPGWSHEEIFQGPPGW
jgi:recombination protein RecA